MTRALSPLVALMICSCACAAQSDTLLSSRVELLAGEAFLDEYAQSSDAYLIDCRTAPEREGGMIDGARGMDFRSDAFRQNVAQLNRSRPVFVYCQSGGRSAQAAELLDSLGFARVVDLKYGYGSLAPK